MHDMGMNEDHSSQKGDNHPQRHEAILLIGPTGSGKTPLGDEIAGRGWQARQAVHFDFGENLRNAVERGTADDCLTEADISFLREVLVSGALLENEKFSIAERMFRSFLARHETADDAVIVLNGLPRHVGQAQAMAAWVNVRRVVYLACSDDVVFARIARDTGGDRAGRDDDETGQVRRKLETFRGRTAQLLDHYEQKGASILTIQVTEAMTAGDMWDVLWQ